MSTAHSIARPIEIEAEVIFPSLSVDAPLNYLVPPAEKPVTYTYPPPQGTPQNGRRNEPHAVSIRDARPFAEDLSLDIQGFALVADRSAVTDFYDDAQVRAVYYPEVEGLLKRRTGAVRVVIFDHVVRNADKAQRKE